MKKFLTFVLVLAMVLSVSSFAMAATDGAAMFETGHVVSLSKEGGTTTYYTTLQKAITAAESDVGNYTITFLTDIAESVIVNQKEDVNLIIDGAGKKMTRATSGFGCIEIYGHARSTGAETLTIKNIVFDIDGVAAWDCIHCNTTDSVKRYAHNVTIQDCTFDFEEGAEVVATRFRQCYDIVITGCEMTEGHSLLWATGGTGLKVENTDIEGAQNGISLGTTTPCEISGCSIDVDGNNGYGIRADGSSATNITIKDSDIEAEKPVIVRNATGTTNLDISDKENQFTPTSGGAPIVLTNVADDKPVEAPTGTVNQTGSTPAKNGNTYYTDVDTAKSEAKPGDVVEITKDDGTIESIVPNPAPSAPPSSEPTTKPSTGSGISVKYNGGNSFSTSNPAVPTSVEIDGVPVTFNGNGSNFTVGCISSDAKWVTIRWNSTTVTTNFTPDGLVECTTVSIPKTGDMSIWAAIAAFFGF